MGEAKSSKALAAGFRVPGRQPEFYGPDGFWGPGRKADAGLIKKADTTYDGASSEKHNIG